MAAPEWKEPSLVWNGATPQPGLARILEIRNDAFIPHFLDGMAGADPASYFQTHEAVPDDDDTLRLYQPLHGCFYLLTASLVCRQLGLPDKAIDRASGESVFFVIRRLTADGEEAWVENGNGGSWKQLAAAERLTVVAGEERLPLHPVQILPQPETPYSVFTDFVAREIHYGYIPTGYREKYRETRGSLIPEDTPAQTLVNDLIAEAEAEDSAFNFRAGTFRSRVLAMWQRLVDPNTPFNTMATDEAEQWLYVLLELGDYLQSYLPTVWSAIEADSPAPLGGESALVALFERLNDPAISLDVEEDGARIPLGTALRHLAPHFDLVRGEGSRPAATYGNTDDENIDLVTLADLGTLVDAAVEQESAPIQLPDGESSELALLVRSQVQPRPTTEARYQIRTAYEYDPHCPCVVSELPSRAFTFAGLMAPEAPARMIRIEAPSIKPGDLRRYAR
ncbi:MAG: hypothetical protein R3272_16445, partial [Candidatus Promineifilaceae bacterium]|nr:hypothetical protein [Candidatus Promineifilaceae bacterium]